MYRLDILVVDSVLEAALDSEALYTALLGAPAICAFDWHPQENILSQLQQAYAGECGYCQTSTFGRPPKKSDTLSIILCKFSRVAEELSIVKHNKRCLLSGMVQNFAHFFALRGKSMQTIVVAWQSDACQSA